PRRRLDPCLVEPFRPEPQVQPGGGEPGGPVLDRLQPERGAHLVQGVSHALAVQVHGRAFRHVLHRSDRDPGGRHLQQLADEERRERRGVPPDEHRLPRGVAGLERLALELDLVVQPGGVVEAPPAVHPGAEQDRRVLQEPLVLALGVDGREPQPFAPGHLPEGGVREKLDLVPAVAQNPPQAHERQDVAVRAVGDHDDGGQEPSPAVTRARALSPRARAASATVRPSTKSTSTGSSIWNSLSTIARNWTMASDWPPSSKKSWSAEVTSTPRISDH